jgi:hypothetical protein
MHSDRRRSSESPLLLGTLALLGALGSSCLNPIPPDTLTPPGEATVSGTITDGCTGSALAGAVVAGSGKSTTTDDEGAFELTGLSPETATLTVTASGYLESSTSITLESGDNDAGSVSLMPVPSYYPEGTQLDVLFVVDNSNSMEAKQKSLTAAFPYFLSTLLSYKVDLHLGVVSTDMGAGDYNLPSCETTGGDGGKLIYSPRTYTNCPVPKDPYITDSGSKSNVSGDLVTQAFECIATLGSGGCGFEQPLASVKKALDGKTNPGFLRTGSVLAVIVLSDEDDCSAVDTKLYDPSQTGLTDPLGPLTSFRCFEFGVTCDTNGRTTYGTRSGCKPSDGKYLLRPSDFASWLDSQRKGKVYFAAIAGSTEKVEVAIDGYPYLAPSCQSSTGSAAPAIRLKAVVDAFSPRSSFTSICSGNLQVALSTIATRIASTTLFRSCK